MATLEARLLIAESTLEIMRLKSLYASYADGKYTDDHRKKPVEERDTIARQQAECFTEDGEFDAGPVGGQARGRAALFENFRAKPFIFAMHMFTNPAIDIHTDGENASGHWMHYLLITPDDTRIPMHGMGFTRDRYRRVDGRWLFNRVESRFRFIVPFTQPWSPSE
jgi:SnoaL-like domain